MFCHKTGSCSYCRYILRFTIYMSYLVTIIMLISSFAWHGITIKNNCIYLIYIKIDICSNFILLTKPLFLFLWAKADRRSHSNTCQNASYLCELWSVVLKITKDNLLTLQCLNTSWVIKPAWWIITEPSGQGRFHLVPSGGRYRAPHNQYNQFTTRHKDCFWA